MDKLRKCKGKAHIFENGKWNWREFDLGYFHQWGIDYEEFADVGVGNYTVAIVELPDGNVIKVNPEDITFLDKIGGKGNE